VSLGLQFALVLEIFNLLLQQPDLSGTLMFDGVELIPQLDILVNLLTNLVIFLLQLVESIFDSSELIQLLPRAVGQFLPNKRKQLDKIKHVDKGSHLQSRKLTVENLYRSLNVSWNYFRVADVSIGSSISSRGTAYCHFGGVTKMPPEEVLAAPCC
jgi:hypothetical protein